MEKKISIVAAVARNGVIGVNGSMPWNLPADLQRFKDLTLGHTVIMGRKTFESVINRNGRPLPNRKNLVVSRSSSYQVPEGCAVANSLESAIATEHSGEVFIIGGGEIYAEALRKKIVSSMHITRIECDCLAPNAVRFPSYESGEWRTVLTESYLADSRNQHAFTFETLERRAP